MNGPSATYRPVGARLRLSSSAKAARCVLVVLGLVLNGCFSAPSEELWRDEGVVREAIGSDVYGGQWRQGNLVVFGVTDGAEDAVSALAQLMGGQPYKVVDVTYTADELEAAMEQVQRAVQDRSDVQVVRIDPRLNKVVITVTDPKAFSIEGVDPALLEITTESPMTTTP